MARNWGTLIHTLLAAALFTSAAATLEAQAAPDAACKRSGWRAAGQLTAGLVGAWVGGIVPYSMIDDIHAPDRRVKGDAGYQPRANVAFAAGSWLGSAAGVYLASPGCRSGVKTLVATLIPSLVLFAGTNEPYMPLIGVIFIAPVQALAGTLFYR